MMNKKICKYSIIRFQPFVETEEFANIGIVLYAPETKELRFKLLSAKKHERITHFFKPLKKEIYTNIIQIIRAEIEHRQKLLTKSIKIKMDFYEELIRPREDIIQYSKNRVLFSTDITKTLDDLFEHYIERSFANKEHHEENMRKKIRSLLIKKGLEKKFKQGIIGQEGKYNVLLPFVNQHHQAAIKPIHFRHPDSNKLTDHGLIWLAKIRHLKRYDFVQPEHILFAYNAPEQKKGILFDAFKEVKNQIEDFGITMIDIEKSEKITNFCLSVS